MITELLSYNPESGQFTWAVTRKKCPAGKLAGSKRADGYVAIFVNGRRYYAHRLAFLFMTGSWPEHEIDHRDGDPSNNAWRNLRPATPRENMRNRGAQANSKTGLKGVHVHSQTGDFYATIKLPEGHKYLGIFKTPEEAHAAYVAAAHQHFGEFARAA